MTPPNDKLELDELDKLLRRCPRLGHEVPFKYCRQAEIDSPCGRILGCWIKQVSVMNYIQKTFDEATLKKLQQPEKSNKIISLVEEVRKHKKQE